MGNKLNIYFSNKLEILYQKLKCSLFDRTTNPLRKRLVVVHCPAMKSWLMLRMAQDPDLEIAMGIEFVYLNQAFEHLLSLTSPEINFHSPSSIELALAMEKELRETFNHLNQLQDDEYQLWKPLIQYLKLEQFNPAQPLSRKIEKRLIGLSQQLARLFLDYGRFAPRMIAQWESDAPRNWQSQLWRRIFNHQYRWNNPSHILTNINRSHISFSFYFFSISFLTSSEFQCLNQLSKNTNIDYFLLSPCAVFWSDIRSDRESAYISSIWQKKLGSESPQIMNLEELLRNRNPLLANFGRMGREMACEIEESHAMTHALYALPDHVKSINETLFDHEDLLLTESSTPLTLLHALQADLLMMRNPNEFPPIDLSDGTSIQIHIASCKRREIQILYHNLLALIESDLSIIPSDIIVMSPQITEYAPYIHAFFGSEESQIDFQLMDLGMQMQSGLVQGFLHLINLSESRWDANNLLQLFEHPFFRRRHQLSKSDNEAFRKWIEEAGVRWGNDTLHRNELLKRNYCEKGMADETPVGTWEYGLSRLLLGLTTHIDDNKTSLLEEFPCLTLDFTQAELLGKYIKLVHSLLDDLAPLHNHTQMAIEDWANYLTCLLDSYFVPIYNESDSIEEYENLKNKLEILKKLSASIKDYQFSFESVKTHLISLFQHREMTYRENHLQAVRFCTLMPLRSIPAKVIAILGMQEGAFPRIDQHTSLNCMIGNELADYVPTSSDHDRYLFLEALHSAQEYLLLSYHTQGQQESKEPQASLVVDELLNYLNRHYLINGKKVIESIVFKHPIDPFDKQYFTDDRTLRSYSEHDYDAAMTFQQTTKKAPHGFLSKFSLTDHPESESNQKKSIIELHSLTTAAKDPVKLYLNKKLEIYLQTDEDRRYVVDEELSISNIDKFNIRTAGLKEPFGSVIHKAEKEGQLPFGLFKTVAVNKIKKEISELHTGLAKYGITPNQIFQIEFCTSCSNPIQVDHDRWLFPAVEIDIGEGKQISVIGKITHASPLGMLHTKDCNLSHAWESFPQFLLYCIAAKSSPIKFEPNLIFAKKGIQKNSFFDDPYHLLKKLVNYHALCLNNLSPLYPEWIPYILKQDVDGLQNKMNIDLWGKDDRFQNFRLKYMEWVLNKHNMPNANEIIHNWKPLADDLFADLINSWFPLGKIKGGNEE